MYVCFLALRLRTSVSLFLHMYLYVCAHTLMNTQPSPARPGQLGLDVNVQWSRELVCELSQTHCIAPALHMGPSCPPCTSQLQPLQATRGYFCSVFIVFSCNLFRTTADSVCAVAWTTVVKSATKKKSVLWHEISSGTFCRFWFIGVFVVILLEVLVTIQHTNFYLQFKPTFIFPQCTTERDNTGINKTSKWIKQIHYKLCTVNKSNS